MSVRDDLTLAMRITESQMSQVMLKSYDEGRAEGIEIGVSTEKERIIKLLEDLVPAKPTYEMPMEYWVQKKLVEKATELIKGEQK